MWLLRAVIFFQKQLKATNSLSQLLFSLHYDQIYWRIPLPSENGHAEKVGKTLRNYHQHPIFQLFLVGILQTAAELFENSSESRWLQLKNVWYVLKYLSPVSSMMKFWMTTFRFMKVAWLWRFMFHRNQKVVIQNFIIEPTGDKYFIVVHAFAFLY